MLVLEKFFKRSYMGKLSHDKKHVVIRKKNNKAVSIIETNSFKKICTIDAVPHSCEWSSDDSKIVFYEMCSTCIVLNVFDFSSNIIIANSKLDLSKICNQFSINEYSACKIVFCERNQKICFFVELSGDEILRGTPTNEQKYSSLVLADIDNDGDYIDLDNNKLPGELLKGNDPFIVGYRARQDVFVEYDINKGSYCVVPIDFLPERVFQINDSILHFVDRNEERTTFLSLNSNNSFEPVKIIDGNWQVYFVGGNYLIHKQKSGEVFKMSLDSGNVLKQFEIKLANGETITDIDNVGDLLFIQVRGYNKFKLFSVNLNLSVRNLLNMRLNKDVQIIQTCFANRYFCIWNQHSNLFVDIENAFVVFDLATSQQVFRSSYPMQDFFVNNNRIICTDGFQTYIFAMQ